MRRALLVLAATTGLVVALSAPAAAGARCVPVPDLEGHVWMLCLS